MPDPSKPDQSEMFFTVYQEQAGSPVVEWFRYANRRAKDIRTWRDKLRDRGLAAVSTAVLWLLISGAHKAMEQLLPLAIAVIAAVFLAPLGQWAYHFVTARYGLLCEDLARVQQQYQDAKTFADELTKRLEDTKAVRINSMTIAANLVSARELGIHTLLNRKIANDADLDKLKMDIDEWEKNTINVMESGRVPLHLISTFRVLGNFDSRVSGGYNPEHNRELAMLWARLGRLLYIMNDIAKDPALIAP